MAMKIVVTGSSGHLGEALVRDYQARGHEVIGIDIRPSPNTTHACSVTDAPRMRDLLDSADVVFHTATLHKPNIHTFSKQQFIETNVQGTQTLLDAAVDGKAKAFIFTSTTSTFGKALAPKNAQEAIWVTEELTPSAKNIYGVTKLAAEDLCELAAKEMGLPCLVLKTARFFPEEDDMSHTKPDYTQDNLKAIEFLNRRADIEDMVSAHRCAAEKVTEIGFDRFIVSATTPFIQQDCRALFTHPHSVVSRYYPQYEDIFSRMGWKMAPRLDRVYVNDKARKKLGWEPKHSFETLLKRLENDQPILSQLAYEIGKKPYQTPTA